MTINAREVEGTFEQELFDFIKQKEGNFTRISPDDKGIPTLASGYALFIKSGGEYVVRPIADVKTHLLQAGIGVGFTTEDWANVDQFLTDALEFFKSSGGEDADGIKATMESYFNAQPITQGDGVLNLNLSDEQSSALTQIVLKESKQSIIDTCGDYFAGDFANSYDVMKVCFAILVLILVLTAIPAGPANAGELGSNGFNAPEIDASGSLVDTIRLAPFTVREQVYILNKERIPKCKQLMKCAVAEATQVPLIATEGERAFVEHRQQILAKCPAIDITRPVLVDMRHATQALGTTEYEVLAGHFGRTLTSDDPIQLYQLPGTDEGGGFVIKMISPTDVTVESAPESLDHIYFGFVDLNNCSIRFTAVGNVGESDIESKADLISIAENIYLLQIDKVSIYKTRYGARLSGIARNGEILRPTCGYEYVPSVIDE